MQDIIDKSKHMAMTEDCCYKTTKVRKSTQLNIQKLPLITATRDIS